MRLLVPKNQRVWFEPNLIEEHILPISTLRRKVFKVPVLADAVLQTQLLPELAPN